MPPTFCRHNRFVQNCPICRTPEPERPARQSGAHGAPTRRRSPAQASATRARAGVRVRRVEQAADDGYRSQLVPGLKASADAERLARELAFSAARLDELESAPPGVYAQIAAEPDREEATWLAFLTAYLFPLEGEDPFASIRAAHVLWAGGELPILDVARGPRSAGDGAAGDATVLAYRAWARRAGTQADAFTGEVAWTPERRFDRLFERLTLPGLGRAPRYELLVILGRLGLYPLRPTTLHLGDDATTLAAKRAFGIGDTLLLERRAAELAGALGLPIEALDLALFNWGRPQQERATAGCAAGADASAIAEGLEVSA